MSSSQMQTLRLSEHLPQKLSLWQAQKMATRDKQSHLMGHFLYRLLSLDAEARDDLADASIHPLDGVVGLFQAADDFLRMRLTEKLFLCKLSLPLAVPNQSQQIELLRFPFRDAFGEEQAHVEDSPVRIVGFTRIGDTEFSKGVLLNRMIGTKSFTTVNNYGEACPPNGISRGFIDMAWKFSSGDSSPMTALLDLHGCALEHPQQWSFLTRVVHGLVIVVSEEAVNNVTKQEQLVALIKSAQREDLSIRIVISFSRDGSGDLSSAVAFLKESLGKSFYGCIIQREFKHMTCKKWLENLPGKAVFHRACREAAEQLSWTIDESKSTLIEGEAVAKECLKIVSGCSSVWDFKREHLPLQTGHQTQKISPFMSHVLKGLKKPCIRDYFLAWLKLGLDRRSRDSVASVRQRHDSIWQAMKSAEEGSSEHNQLVEAFRKADEDTARGSLGVEHVLRELGLLYEAMAASAIARQKDLFGELPGRMLDLLWAGHPVELMDGDTCHVPVAWATAVLGQLEARLGPGKRILVLSALGVQSSGKSTLLNAMFGVKFAVSAGRCTRGVYGQLVPLPDSKRDFSHVLVVDTEGLKAVELGVLSRGNEHDNRIAAFVLGLADVSLINIKGENRVDVQAVLQIGLISMLRSARLSGMSGMSGSCETTPRAKLVFVHQNAAGAGNVKACNANSQRALLQELDDVVQSSADFLGLADSYAGLASLVAFDVERHVAYLPGYWAGDPPAAAVNAGYAGHVLQLKELVVGEAEAGELKSPSGLAARLAEVWSGVRSEDFIFRFKNAAEVKAFHALETASSGLLWRLAEAGDRVVGQARRDLDKAELVEDVDPAFSASKAALDAALQKVMAEEVLPGLAGFYTTRTDRWMLEQWKAFTEKRVRAFHDDLRADGFAALETDALARKHALASARGLSADQVRALQARARLGLAQKRHASEQEATQSFLRSWSDFLGSLHVDGASKDYVSEMLDVVRLAHGSFFRFVVEPAWLKASERELPLPRGYVRMNLVGKFLLQNFASKPDRDKQASCRWDGLTGWCQAQVRAAPVQSHVSPTTLKAWLDHIENEVPSTDLGLRLGMAKFMAGELQQRHVDYHQRHDLRALYERFHKEDQLQAFLKSYFSDTCEENMERMAVSFSLFAADRLKTAVWNALLARIEEEEVFSSPELFEASALKSYLVGSRSFEPIRAYLTSKPEAAQKHLRALIDLAWLHSVEAQGTVQSVRAEFLDALESAESGEAVNLKYWLSKLNNHLNIRKISCPSELLVYKAYNIDKHVSSCKMKSTLLRVFKDVFKSLEVESIKTDTGDEMLSHLLQANPDCLKICQLQCPECHLYCCRPSPSHGNPHFCALCFINPLSTRESCTSHNQRSDNQAEADSARFYWRYLYSRYTPEFKQLKRKDGGFQKLLSDLICPSTGWSNLTQETVLLNMKQADRAPIVRY